MEDYTLEKYKEYDLRVGDHLSFANLTSFIYAGMPNQDTFCLVLDECGPLYFSRDTNKIEFYPKDFDDKGRILKVSNVTPRNITLTEIVEEPNYDYRISRRNGKLRLPNAE